MVFQVTQQSAVLKPTATLGVINSGPRVSVSRLGSEHFVTTVAGSTFHIYDCDNLQLQYLSRPLLSPIRVVLNVGECTAVSCDADVLIFHKMSLLLKLSGHSSPVELLSHIGDSFLVSSSKAEVCVWKLPSLTRTSRPVEESQSPFSKLALGFNVTAMLHVPTYLNKMLFAGDSGELELWNINTGKLIHKFLAISLSPIMSLAASPAVDVIAVGHSNGEIRLVNLALDEQLMSLNQADLGGVSSLAFRCDFADGMLVAGSTGGDIAVWDLSNKRIHSVISAAHPGGVASLFFLGTLPLLLSAGLADNAVSIHIFDKPDNGARLLKERRGFTGPITFLLPYGDHDLIAVAQPGEVAEVGRLNLIQSQQNKVWPQAKALATANSGKPWKFRNIHQLPRVIAISNDGVSKLRHFDWPSVVTVHEGLPDAYVWSPHQESLVARMLIVPRIATTGSVPPCAVQTAVSTCGNYAVLGLANGEIHRFNLQSCAHRGSLPQTGDLPIVHLEFISARDMISADSNSIKIWKVVPRPELVATLTCVANIEQICVYNFLVAVAHRTEVSIVDIHADRLARKMPVTAPVTCMAWAAGGRWLAVATADARLVIYDVPTGAIIDRVQFTEPCLSIVFMHGNTEVVTSHATGGIRVWQNIALLNGPGFLPEDEFVLIDSACVSKKVTKPKTQPRLLTQGDTLELSSGNRSRWQQILKLDEIKERNRPTRAAEKPKSAPFFLPVKYRGVDPVFVSTPDMEVASDLKHEVVMDDSSEVEALVASGDHGKIRSHLLALSPAGVHIFLSQLENCLEAFLEFLLFEVSQGANIDLVSTWTSLLMKDHSLEAFPEQVTRLSKAFKQVHANFFAEANQLQCLLKVVAALQLHR